MQCRRNITKKHLYNDTEKYCRNVEYRSHRQRDIKYTSQRRCFYNVANVVLLPIKDVAATLCARGDNMTGRIYPIEASKAHRFYHQIRFLHDYLKWKNIPLCNGRQKLNLINIEGHLLV